jgi:hypothetical protein
MTLAVTDDPLFRTPSILFLQRGAGIGLAGKCGVSTIQKHAWPRRRCIRQLEGQGRHSTATLKPTESNPKFSLVK